MLCGSICGLDIRDLPGRRLGLDAASIGKMLRIPRNNVSKDLALLNKEKILMRIKGKPVLYLDIKTLEMKLGRALTEKEKETGIIETIEVRKEESLPIKEQVNSLDSIVGSKGSLRTQVEHAKAAILYPPNGLHVILFGPTGVGKTMFAEKMYAFAQETEVIKKDAPFCVLTVRTMQTILSFF